MTRRVRAASFALAVLVPAAVLAQDARFDAYPAQRALVEGLRRDLNVRVSTSRAFRMNGGYRGMVDFVPALPVGPHARHLEWLDRAMRTMDRFAQDLARVPGARPVRYRTRDITVLFTRSTNTTTPNAFVTGWEVHYNVNGSVLRDPERVLETLVHELFHSNDAEHGDWSRGALGAIHRSIAARCGVTRASTPCLDPYAPNTLRVRNGTYYAFHGGNDVREYAAELAVRYFREHTGRWSGRPFKCGPPENARAWAAMRDEFFGGVDQTPACR